MTETSIDPYGGYRERWSVDQLNQASQGAGIVCDTPATRAMPAVNQIVLPDRAHFEACGPVAITAAAFAAGYIEAGDITGTAIDVCNYLGDAAVAQNGTSTPQLLDYARHRGWPVHEDDRQAGTLAIALIRSGQVGVSALNTAYGTGASWNVLHPEAGGPIGHWEGFGLVDGPQEHDMDPQTEQTLREWVGWMTFVVAEGRLADSGGYQWFLGELSKKGYSSSLWEMLAGAEATKGGGLLGLVARQQAQIDALVQHLASTDQATAVNAAADKAMKAHQDAMDKAMADLQAQVAAGKGSVQVPISSKSA